MLDRDFDALERQEIYGVLFSRADPGTFHWAICIAYDRDNVIKLHAKQVSNHWFFEDPPPSETLTKSPIVAAVIKIGIINHPGDLNPIIALLKGISLSIPIIDTHIEPIFTCRVWFKEAIRQLHNHGYIICPDVYAFEAECKAFALTNDASQPGWRGLKRFDACSVHVP